MPIMTMQVWNMSTRSHMRAVRTPELQAIDRALQTLHGAGTPANKLALETVIATWITANTVPAPAQWLSSAVTTLQRDVQSSLGSQSATKTYAPLVAPGAYTQAAAGIILSGSTDKFVTVSAPIQQNTMGQDFAWTSHFRLQKIARGIHCTVPVAPAPITAGKVAIDQAMKDIWKVHINAMWNGTVIKIDEKEKLDLTFSIDWKAAGAPNSFTLSAVASTPIVTAGMTWQQKKAEQERVRAGAEVGTPHMQQFGSEDRQAVAHEFGHMLGCPDEYDTVTYMGQPVPAGTFNQPGFSTNSIMNNTAKGGRMFPRHYQLVKRAYEQWKNKRANSTQIWWAGSNQ